MIEFSSWLSPETTIYMQQSQLILSDKTVIIIIIII